MSNRKASPTEPEGEIEPMSEELARMIDNASKLWCDEIEPMSKELARIVADATKQDCELEPMTPELSRLVDEMLTTKQDCDEFEQMPPELSRVVDEVLCHTGAALPQHPHKSATKRIKTASSTLPRSKK